MSKARLKWIIIAMSLVLVGIVIIFATFCFAGWDFNKLNNAKYITNTYDINEEFTNIVIDSKNSDVELVLSEDGKGKVACFEDEKQKHSVKVEQGKLIINQVNNKKWYENIGISTKSQKVTVYLTKTEYEDLVIKGRAGDVKIAKEFKLKSIDISVSTGDVKCYASCQDGLKIRATTGDILVDKISSKSLTVSVSTGDINISEVTCIEDIKASLSTGKINIANVCCKNIISNGDTGDITLNNVKALEQINIERDTGDVKLISSIAKALLVETDTGDVTLDRFDAGEIYVETDTGDVKGTLLSEKIFITNTDTGSIKVPESVTGGKCKITTDTGDIKISILSQ